MTHRLPSIVGTFLLAASVACGGGSDTTTGPPPPAAPNTPSTPGTPGTPSTPSSAPLRTLAAAQGRSIGTALDATFFGQSATFGTNPAAYDTLVAHEFSMVTAGNVMKWEPLNRNGRFTYRWTNPDLFVAFAQANGMKVRGHTLAWYNQNPTWLVNGTWTADTLTAILKEHIDSVLTHYKGKIYAWDVVNEAFNDGTGTLRTAGSPWGSVIGAGYIDVAFQEARKADPAALLFYNDYNLETPGAKQDSVYARLSGMKQRGIPIDGVGFQGHFQINADGGGAPSRQTLVNTFNRFAALGLKIEITELDVRVRTPGAGATELAAQRQLYGDVVSACLAVSACDAIVVWGVNDGESWIPGTFPGYGQALLFDDTLGKKATYDAVKTALGG